MAGLRDLPPGIHLQALCTPDGESARQLRILGDDRRGYLIAGLAGLPDDDDFWFATLDSALGRAERAGVERSAWREIVEVGEAKML